METYAMSAEERRHEAIRAADRAFHEAYDVANRAYWSARMDEDADYESVDEAINAAIRDAARVRRTAQAMANEAYRVSVNALDEATATFHKALEAARDAYYETYFARSRVEADDVLREACRAATDAYDEAWSKE